MMMAMMRQSEFSPFRLAAQGAEWTEGRMNECHQEVNRFVVKGLNAFPTVGNTLEKTSAQCRCISVGRGI